MKNEKNRNRKYENKTKNENVECNDAMRMPNLFCIYFDCFCFCVGWLVGFVNISIDK